MARRRRRAELVFRQLDDQWDEKAQKFLGRWRGSLMNKQDCIDRTYERLVSPNFNPVFIISERVDGDFDTVCQGSEYVGGRRYGRASSLNEAQQDGIDWAKRRFYYA